MTLGEQIEFAIYKAVEAVGKGESRSVDLSFLRELVPGSHNIDVIDALKRLHDDQFISLIKYAETGPITYIGAEDTGNNFFTRDLFRITIRPKGRLDYERRLQQAREAVPPPSAGNHEKTAGKGEFQTAFTSYTTQELIGQGGNGIVYRVVNEYNKSFAIKVLRARSPSSKLERFRQEIAFCQKIQHDNIISVVDYGFVSGREKEKQLFYVMPLYESTLEKAMRLGIAHESILDVFDQILDGIETAHGRGIVHRDLKPENIFCDIDLHTVVIGDFGIAHFTEDDLIAAVETSNHEKMGNFEYASPEQRKRDGIVNQAADIWALGLILTEMFTTEVPHGKGHKLISSVAPNYAYLDVLVDAMLQHAPEDRPSIDKVKRLLRPGRSAATVSAEAEAIGAKKLDLDFKSDEDLCFHVEIVPNGGGLYCKLINNRPLNLNAHRALVRDARSFDIKKSVPREGFGFKEIQLTGGRILSGDITPEAWLIRVKDDHLEVGSDVGSGILRWPGGVPGDRQIWFLSLMIDGESLSQWNLSIVIEWHRPSNSFNVSHESWFRPWMAP